MNENSHTVGLTNRSISDVNDSKDTQTKGTKYTLQTVYTPDTANCLRYSYSMLNYG